MRLLPAVAVLLVLMTACGPGASVAVEGATVSAAATAKPAATVTAAATPAAPPPVLRGCDSVEVTIWMNTLGLSGWSVGEVASGRTGLYMPEHPEADERIAAVREKCGDTVEVTTGPPIELVG